EGDAIAADDVARRDRPALAGDPLEGDRGVLAQRAARQPQAEIAVGGEVNPAGAREVEGDPGGVSVRREAEVVLELALGAVVAQIDARVYPAVGNAAVGGDRGLGARGAVAAQVVDGAGEAHGAARLRGGARA